jgi:hypothetical protein
MSEEHITDYLRRKAKSVEPEFDIVEAHRLTEAADRIEELEARYHREQDRIERLIEENEYLRDSLEHWIFHHQRAMGQKPEVARQYAQAWMFRNAGGKEPE